MHKERIEILLGIVMLIAVCAGVYYFAPHHRSTPIVDKGMEISPEITAELAAKIKTSAGFDFLISYSERRFEPAEATITHGDTVRFVNNDPGARLWVAATAADGVMYPGTEAACGQSAFDACAALQPGEFWEFTFEEAGMWSYKNNAERADTGTINVQ